MPAYRAAHLLPQVLAPLVEMQRKGEILEILVVDDQSPDDTAETARGLSARVLVTPKNGGPGAARNLAAEHASGDVLWFVDSDVIAKPGNAARIRDAFASPDVGAVFGSYDDAPASKYWFSQYKNLLHHFHHQKGNRDAVTFWAGCGAVRKDVFLEVGGFDIETYKVPSIEDIELGYRISGAGHRIVLDPALQCKHLKHWTIRNALETDIFKRALPWARLMISREGVTNDLNASTAERLRAVLALVFVLSVLALPLFPAVWPVTLAATLLVFGSNFALFRLFLTKGGPAMAVASMLYHQVYYIYSATVFVWCLFEFHVLGRNDKLAVSA
jgi:glycosyltransferase involved in cell wall biosynthesis